MESNVITEPSAPDVSTVVEPRGHNDNPAASQHKEIETPEPKQEEAKRPESRMDTIKRAHADIEAKNAKTEEVKADATKPEEKTETKAEVKESAPKADANEPEAKASPKPSEGRKIIEAPARFLPRAKELWNNVPHPVREEFERVMRENETEVQSYREHKQFREEIKEFEDLATRQGVPVKQALSNYVDIERSFSEDPARGFQKLCQNLNISAPQAIGHILRSANVTPQQLIEHMQRDPSAYTSLAQRPMQQTQQQQQSAQRAPDPEITSLKEQVAAMQAERVQNNIIAPFAREYPEYHSNEQQIAKVLQSGIIEQIHGNGLSPRDKLEVALFMVAPHAKRVAENQTAPVPSPAVETSPVGDLRGNKSIKGAPTPGTDGSGRRRGNMSRTEALDAAWAELGLR